MADRLQSALYMIRVVAALIVVGVSLLSIAGSAQSARTATPALALESLTGRDSFDRYCAACHGADGRGAGPATSALKTRPADLTTLAERNGGSFPRQRIASFVEGTARPLSAHGTSDMPVWGSTFRGLESSDARVKVRLENLVAYVESLQRPADASTRSSGPRKLTGAQLFRTYCASCHGETALGTGPVRAALTRPIPDLTTYTARNGGVFPGERLRQIIAGRGPAAHGDRTMPVWGAVFSRQADGTDDVAGGQIDALVAFLQSMQQRGAE
jgi:mono/diheme cytochrome c family protein